MVDAANCTEGEASITNDLTNDDLRNHCSGYGSLPSAGMSEHIHNSASYHNPKQWSILMKQKISCGDESFSSSKKTIILAPKLLYDVRPQAYTPQLLFIGPLTPRLLLVDPLTTRSSMETNTVLSTMDCCKAELVKRFLEGCPSKPQLHNLMADLFQVDPSPNPRSKSNPIDAYFDIPNYFDKEALKLLITIDYIVVVVVLQKVFSNITCTPFMNFLPYMPRDLFIVGNQVPLSNLVKLFEYQSLPEEHFTNAIQRLIWCWSPFTSKRKHYSNVDFQNSVAAPSLQECEHLLDYLYQACVNNTSEKANSSNVAGEESPINQESELCKVRVGCLWRACAKNSSVKQKLELLEKLPRASELSKIGVNFKAVDGNATAIRYDKKNLVVELPKLVVYDDTECMLRNLLAYEHTCKEEDHICSYVWLMDVLIDNTDDLQIFYRDGVLENHLGSDEKLIAMWNDICVSTLRPQNDRLTMMARAILTHYETNWRKIYMEFRRRYFSKPWFIMSTVAAVLLLFMTVLATVYTVMEFYKH